MNKVNQITLIIILLLSGTAIYLYIALQNCQKVPDFRPSLSHVKKFTGYQKSFRFYVECNGKKVFEDCNIRSPQDVTNQTVILRMLREGNIGKSSYVVDWVEDVQFYVDLSNSASWDIDMENNKIVFHLPAIEFDRILRNEAYLPYVKDRKWLKDDENELLKLVMRTHEISERKSREYLKTHRQAINQEMAKSIKSFIRTLTNKLGYPGDIEIDIIYQKV